MANTSAIWQHAAQATNHHPLAVKHEPYQKTYLKKREKNWKNFLENKKSQENGPAGKKRQKQQPKTERATAVGRRTR